MVAEGASPWMLLGVLAASSSFTGLKYRAMMLFVFLSVALMSHSTRKNAIIAVMKSANAIFQAAAVVLFLVARAASDDDDSEAAGLPWRRLRRRANR